MTDLAESITREHCVSKNIDPTGKKWVISHIKQTSLYEICVDKKGDAVRAPSYPNAEMEGFFTHSTKAQKAIEQYLTAAWDASEAASAKAERKAQAEKEAPKKED